ncbi:MAG: GNAT family N-acetyltransferase, partial [Nocardioidaceae bacterium]
MVRVLVERALGDARVGDLVDQLRTSWAWVEGLSLVAELGGAPVGHVLFTKAWLDAPSQLVEVLVLSPLCVAPEHQGRRIGDLLVREGLRRLRDRPEPAVFLEGSPAYYPRFGFRPGGDLGFRRPSLRIPEPAFQVVLRPPYEPWMTGTLVY